MIEARLKILFRYLCRINKKKLNVQMLYGFLVQLFMVF